MWRRLIACVAGASFLASSPALSAPVLYDHNNSGNLNAITPLGLIGISEGNFVMVQPGGLTAGDIGDTFLLRFQAKSDGPVYNGGGVGFTFPGEVTVEFVMPLEFTGIVGTRWYFGIDASVAAGPNNYYRMYHDPSPLLGDSSVSAGTGFNDGTLILEGSFFDVYYTIDTADLPGTMLAKIDLASYGANAFDIPAGYYAEIDGAAYIPSQLAAAAQIAGYAPVSGDIRGSVDLTMTFVPETSTFLLVGMGAALSALFLRRRPA